MRCTGGSSPRECIDAIDFLDTTPYSTLPVRATSFASHALCWLIAYGVALHHQVSTADQHSAVCHNLYTSSNAALETADRGHDNATHVAEPGCDCHGRRPRC